MWILNFIATKWIILFVPALLVWLTIKWLSKSLKPKMNGKLIFLAAIFWLASTISFFTAPNFGTGNEMGLLLFFLYCITGFLSIIMYFSSFKGKVENASKKL